MGLSMTICPHCGRPMQDDRLDNDGFPKVGQRWHLPAIAGKGDHQSGGPEQTLLIEEINKTDLRGREIRGLVVLPKNKKEEELDDHSYPYSTNLETFNKVWILHGRLLGEKVK